MDHQMTGTGPQFGHQKRHTKSRGLIDRDQHLANVANSVSGFYKDGASDHNSNMSRTQDNFASNIINNRRSGGANKANDGP